MRFVFEWFGGVLLDYESKGVWESIIYLMTVDIFVVDL